MTDQLILRTEFPLSFSFVPDVKWQNDICQGFGKSHLSMNLDSQGAVIN